MKLRPPVILQPMDMAEIDDIPFGFGAHMCEGEVIAGVSINAEVEQGEPDPSAQAMVSGEHAIGTIDDDVFTVAAAGAIVLQRFDATARIAGNIYCLRCTVTLSSGRQLVAAGHVAVKRL